MCKTYNHFKIFRFALGIYLAYHFYDLMPYAEELFTTRGMFWDIDLFVISIIDVHIELFIYSLVIVSLLLAFGFYQSTSSIIIWIGWVYLFNRNMFISNPSIPYVGLLLLATAILPEKENWTKCPHIHWVMWFLTMLGYTLSGLHKLQCQSWLDGTALSHVLTSFLARDTILLQFVLSLPIIKILTWSSLILEISCLPLGVFYYTRKIYWTMLVSMHLGVLILINFTDLTMGMLLVHLFIFDTA